MSEIAPVLPNQDVCRLTLSNAMYELLLVKSYLQSFSGMTDTDDGLYVDSSAFSLTMGDLANRLTDIHSQLDSVNLAMK